MTGRVIAGHLDQLLLLFHSQPKLVKFAPLLTWMAQEQKPSFVVFVFEVIEPQEEWFLRRMILSRTEEEAVRMTTIISEFSDPHWIGDEEL